MDRLSSFEKFLNFEPVNENELDLIIDYICGNLNSSFLNNYRYWYDMYSYATKTRIVIRHKQEKNEVATAKLGQCICKNEVVNFLENENKKCNCEKGCSSAFFNAVF